jgi:hypothetical protein
MRPHVEVPETNKVQMPSRILSTMVLLRSVGTEL